jgi:NAD(P)-dependent dehydrogenase (short-subunit alcohol dehydrogenase family)
LKAQATPEDAVLAGKTALVTGAGTGLGKAMAIGLAKAGARLCLVGRRESLLAETADALATMGCTSDRIPADVTKDVDVQRIARLAGHVDILVNNAGTSDRQPWQAVKGEDWDRVLAINLTAAFQLSQVFAPGMAAAGSGRIINVASVYGTLAPHRDLYPDAASFDLPSYGASKAGLIGLTRHLAAILGPAGITVNALSPGMMETERTTGLIGPGTRQALVARTPVRRLGQPADLEAAIVFLASPGAAFVTGHNLIVDGGFSLL